jgi:hypothetical protein
MVFTTGMAGRPIPRTSTALAERLLRVRTFGRFGCTI